MTEMIDRIPLNPAAPLDGGNSFLLTFLAQRPATSEPQC